MSRLTRDGTTEPVSRDQILGHVRTTGQGNIHFLCSADHEQDWQPYPVCPYSAICDDDTYIHTFDLFSCSFIDTAAAAAFRTIDHNKSSSNNNNNNSVCFPNY